MSGQRRTLVGGALILALIAGAVGVGLGHDVAGQPAAKAERLPVIGRAPAFTLTDQHGERLALADLRGRVVVVTFIYATCTDFCPLLTAKLTGLQPRLGPDLGRQIVFVGITVDPERDTPEVLRRYAEHHGADPRGWAFLTGTPEEVRAMARRYGVYYREASGGDVEHTFLTSLVDRRGMLRVQYMGVRFDPDELLRDLQNLMDEHPRR